jgi:UPF0755 protein
MKTLRRLLLLLIAVLLATGAAGWWWTTQPLALAAQRVEISVPEGASLRTAAARAVEGGVRTPTVVLAWYFRLAGRGQTIKPGVYAITRGMTPGDVLDKLVRGDQITLALTLVEGWTFRQVRQALGKAESLRHDSAALTDAQIMQALGRPGVHPEGRFFPDTYRYAKDSDDLGVLRQAAQLMDQRLAAAWAARAANLPLQSPDEALILASIVEKETGLPQDRADIGAVFINRLRIGMKLQTDPTVIYGMGEQFNGNLRRRDLEADTPYNTYTRTGLPPTPIALPGKAALAAAVQPSDSKALYFVARGDGSSQFSNDLDAHNRAVNQYQRRGR